MTSIDQLKQDLIFGATLAGQPLTFHTTWGLFSPKQIDEGTGLLIDQLEISATTRPHLRRHCLQPTGKNRR
jgi:16S rRNA (guanine1207-N2)-methyltransferase